MKKPRSNCEKFKLRRRRGISTIIGTLIFLLILLVAFYTIVTIFGYYNDYTQAIAKSSQEQQANSETSVSINSFEFGSLPSNITTVGSLNAPGNTFDRKLFSDLGLWWYFYANGTSINYVTSPDGSNWSTPIFVNSSTVNGYNFGVWESGNTIYYVLAPNGTTSFSWSYGMLNSSGFVSWSIPPTAVATTNNVDSFASIVADTSGNVWVALNTNSGTVSDIEIWEYSSGSWSQSNFISPVASGTVPILVPLGSGVCLIYGEGNVTSQVYVTSTNGASWSSPVSPPSDYSLLSSSATSIGNTLYFVGLASGNYGSASGTVNTWSFTNGDSSISSETLLNGNITSWNTAISEVDSRTLIAFYGTNQTLYMQYNLGGAWYPSEALSEGNYDGLTSSFSGGGVIWWGGTLSSTLGFLSVPILTTVNNSPFAVHLISLYVYDPATQALVHFDTNSTAQGVSGSFDYWIGAGEVMSVPFLPFAWSTNQNYLITVATDQGVLTSETLGSPS